MQKLLLYGISKQQIKIYFNTISWTQNEFTKQQKFSGVSMKKMKINPKYFFFPNNFILFLFYSFSVSLLTFPLQSQWICLQSNLHENIRFCFRAVYTSLLQFTITINAFLKHEQRRKVSLFHFKIDLN